MKNSHDCGIVFMLLYNATIGDWVWASLLWAWPAKLAVKLIACVMLKSKAKLIYSISGLFRKFSCMPIFRILGRLTYGAFVIHIFVARIVLGTLRTPLYFGIGVMVSESDVWSILLRDFNFE